MIKEDGEYKMIKRIEIIDAHPVFTEEDKEKMSKMGPMERRRYAQMVAQRQGIHHMCGQ